MVSNRALSIVPQQGSEVEWWNMAQQQAGMLVKTGFLPDSIKTPEQAIAIMMKGRELGIPSMYALSNIVIIKGKPTCNSELMLALIYRDHGDAAMRIVESTNEACQIAYRRARWPKEQVYAFTAADAQRAGLMTTDTWKKYTAAMLRARCISAVARMAFPDSIAGMYTPEELGADIEVTDDGEYQVVATPPVQQPTPIAEVIPEPMITENQIRMIGAVAEQIGMSWDQVKAMHGKASAKELTRVEASNLITKLKAIQDDMPEPDEAVSQPELINGSDPDRYTY